MNGHKNGKWGRASASSASCRRRSGPAAYGFSLGADRSAVNVAIVTDDAPALQFAATVMIVAATLNVFGSKRENC